jgi:hypothetical protein
LPYKFKKMTINEAFGDVAEVLAGLAPERIVDIKAPIHISKRVELLVNRKKDGIITYDETMELERFLALNMLISLAKARARVLLSA